MFCVSVYLCVRYSVLFDGPTWSDIKMMMMVGAISGQRQSWKTSGELGVSKSMECDIFPSVL